MSKASLHILHNTTSMPEAVVAMMVPLHQLLRPVVAAAIVDVQPPQLDMDRQAHLHGATASKTDQ